MKVNYQSNPMLKNKIEKIYIKLKRGEKKQSTWIDMSNSQPESWNQDNFIKNKLKKNMKLNLLPTQCLWMKSNKKNQLTKGTKKPTEINSD